MFEYELDSEWNSEVRPGSVAYIHISSGKIEAESSESFLEVHGAFSCLSRLCILELPPLHQIPSPPCTKSLPPLHQQFGGKDSDVRRMSKNLKLFLRTQNISI